MIKQHCGIIGFASDQGGITSGSKHGPRSLRQLGLQGALERLGYAVTDYGDIEASLYPESVELVRSLMRHSSPDEKYIHHLIPCHLSCENLYNKVLTVLEDNMTPIVLGGDHSLSLGSVPAVADFYHNSGQSIGMLWIDTHPDINIPINSPSNRLFGMPVAYLSGCYSGMLSRLQRHQQPAVKPLNIAYVGLREVDPGERELIRNAGIAAYTMKDIDYHGIGNIMDRALAVVSRNTAGFVTSFDIDVCDPHLAPGTGTPKRGGLTYREAHLCMEMISDSRQLLALELAELNPSLDHKNKTASLGLSLIEAAFGKSIL